MKREIERKNYSCFDEIVSRFSPHSLVREKFTLALRAKFSQSEDPLLLSSAPSRPPPLSCSRCRRLAQDHGLPLIIAAGGHRDAMVPGTNGDPSATARPFVLVGIVSAIGKTAESPCVYVLSLTNGAPRSARIHLKSRNPDSGRPTRARGRARSSLRITPAAQ